MSVTVPHVEASRPETLTGSAADLRRKAAHLATLIDTQRATIDGLRNGWQGAASNAALAKAEPTLLRMQQIHDAVNRAQAVLQDGGTQLARSRTDLLHTVGHLSAQGWQVSPDGTVTVLPGSPLDRWAQRSPVNAMTLNRLAATNSHTVRMLLAGFDTTDRRLDRNLRTAVGGLDGAPAHFGSGGAPRTPPAWDDGSQIPVRSSPEDVYQWWNALPAEEQLRLLDDWPDTLGNLDGIPVAARDDANRTIMERDINRPAVVAASRGVTVDEVLANPDRYGMTPRMLDRHHNGLKAKEALDGTAERAGTQTFLQVYYPELFGGDGRAAIAIGNPDASANTAVVVPGTGNSVESGWMNGEDATSLYLEANAADRDHHTAVVAWMGYDAPDAPYDPRIGTTALAREGGELLAGDVNALNVTSRVDGHMTVLGHSYGSTTVADAAAGFGMRTDDVVLVGCPGTDMARSAADFRLNEGGNLYVGAASTDPVTQLSGIPQLPVLGTDFSVSLGNDPAVDGYGSTRFKAEVAGFTDPLTDHTRYYADGGESLYSMADIVSGHGAELAAHGMTAEHRRDDLLTDVTDMLNVPAFEDPELFRPGSSGHRH